MPLIPAHGTYGHEDLYESEVSMVYTLKSQGRQSYREKPCLKNIKINKDIG